MTNSTIPESGSSFFWDAASCMSDPVPCAKNAGLKVASFIFNDLPILAVKQGPKIAFKSSIFIAKWSGRFVYNLGSTAAGWVKPDFLNITTPKIIEDLYNTAADKAAYLATHLSDQATSWVTDLPINTVESKRLWAEIEPDDSFFQATDLTPHILTLAFCTNRCSKNLFDALHHTKLLLTGTRKVATSYSEPTINSRIPTIITKTKTYTTPGLLKAIAMEVGFATFWSTTAYYTYESLYDDVLAATGGNEKHALYVARKIAFLTQAVPIAYDWLKAALYAPASTDSSGQGTEAPKSQYPAPGAAGARTTTHIPLLRDIENMSFDEAMKVLEERDASIAIEV